MTHTGVTVTKQFLAIQKTLAHNGFQTLSLLQERGEQVAKSFLASGDGNTADAHRLWGDWSETARTGREALEAGINGYFEMLERMLLPSDHKR